LNQVQSEPCSDPALVKEVYIVKPPTLDVDIEATVAKPFRRSEVEREKYKARIYAIDKAYGSTLYNCGDKTKRNPQGVGCHCKVCEDCIPRISRQNARQLIQVVTRIQETHPQAQFLTGSITMASWYGTLLERMTLLCDTLTKARKCAFWKKCVIGYEECLHYSGTNDIHGHVQPLYILKPDADLEAFKRSLHAYLQKEIGDRYVNYKKTWMTWLQPASPEPELCHYLHSDINSGGFISRKFSDLKKIVPCIRATDQVRRGGIINETRKELGMSKKQSSTQTIRVSITKIEENIHTLKLQLESDELQALVYDLEDQLEEMKGELDFQEWQIFKAQEAKRSS